jgi:diguanylate cyclase (GGDEF)-like protein
LLSGWRRAARREHAYRASEIAASHYADKTPLKRQAVRHSKSSRDAPRPSNEPAETSAGARVAAHTEILRLIASHTPLPTTLLTVAELVERELPGVRAAILLRTTDGDHLSVAAAPSLPAQFVAVIDGDEIGPQGGPSGVAAYERRVEVRTDIARDPKWQSSRDAAGDIGLASCWSTPFVGAQDEVLGAFAVYVTDSRAPGPDELTLLREAGHLAAVAVQQDTSQRRLRELIRTDPLTNLATRDVLTDRLTIARLRAAKTGRYFAVIVLGVDGVSAVNESFGHAAGDELLRLVAQRLLITAGPSATVVRMWGDEFGLLVENVQSIDEAGTLAARLLRALAAPFDVDGLDLSASAGLGVAMFGADADESDALRAAGAALDRAKALGRGQVVMHDQSAPGRDDVVALAPALRHGIAAQEFGLAYQPILRLGSERVVRYEALLRWTSGDHEGVPPDTFVPMAERMGLVGDLGRHALMEALGELHRHTRPNATPEVGVAVNVSVHQLSDDSLPGTVEEALAKYAVPARNLTLEVTEGVLLRSGGIGWRILSALRDLGTRIAIDDFGTGFGQLSYLRQFAFDEIKIDRSFIADMVDDARARAIVTNILSLANSLDAEVVAEGIERTDQRDMLIDLGCDLGQGYLLGAPGPMR